MTVTILEVHDQPRRCGDRHPGGLYLVSSEFSHDCGMLPLRLDPCECCGQVVKLTRGLQRVNVPRLFAAARCSHEDLSECRFCLINTTGMGYLMGIGARYYKTWHSFLAEATLQGVSKRIAQIPHDFKVGKSVILLGHPKVFTEMVPADQYERERQAEDGLDEDDVTKALPMIEGNGLALANKTMVARDVAGIVCLFRPTAIQYITVGSESQEFLEGLVKRGITPVRVVVDPKPEPHPAR